MIPIVSRDCEIAPEAQVGFAVGMSLVTWAFGRHAATLEALVLGMLANGISLDNDAVDCPKRALGDKMWCIESKWKDRWDFARIAGEPIPNPVLALLLRRVEEANA